jgi:hypothetical protein
MINDNIELNNILFTHDTCKKSLLVFIIICNKNINMDILAIIATKVVAIVGIAS